MYDIDYIIYLMLYVIGTYIYILYIVTNFNLIWIFNIIYFARLHVNISIFFHTYVSVCVCVYTYIYIYIDILCWQTSSRFGLLVDCLHDRRQGELGHGRRVGRRQRKRLQSVVRIQEPSRLDIAVGSDGWQVYWDCHYYKVSQSDVSRVE